MQCDNETIERPFAVDCEVVFPVSASGGLSIANDAAIYAHCTSVG